jgi:hypothetical protein
VVGEGGKEEMKKRELKYEGSRQDRREEGEYVAGAG